MSISLLLLFISLLPLKTALQSIYLYSFESSTGAILISKVCNLRGNRHRCQRSQKGFHKTTSNRVCEIRKKSQLAETVHRSNNETRALSHSIIELC